MPLSADDPQVVGDYRLLDRLGSGGMGVVYLARSPSGRQVAVKVVHAQFTEDEEFRSRFRQEVAAARRVSGAFTAPVVDADPDAERPWMATLYVPGPTLSQELAERGPLSAAKLRRLALGLAEALHDMHRVGVIHRDLKPANVLIARDGPRVIDFGISRAGDSQALTVTGRVLGTPPFMSPEQLHRPREVTAASDVFSLGTLLMYAATGRGPFDADSPYLTAYRVVHEPPSLADLAEPLRDVVARCLAKDPAKRPELPELVRLFTALPTRGSLRADASGGAVKAGAKAGAGASGGSGREPLPGGAADGDGAAGAGDAGPGAPRDRDGDGAGEAGAGAERAEGQPREQGGERAGGAHHEPGGAPDPGRLATLTRLGRRRGRLLVSIVSVLLVLALGGAAYLVYGPDHDDGVRTSGTAAGGVRRVALPAGWRPWEVMLQPTGTTPKGPARAAPLGEIFEPQCMTGGTRLFCGGMGFPTVRLDPRSGSLLWRTDALADPSEMTNSSHPVALTADRVFVHDAPNGETTRLVALDAATGHEVWSREVSDGTDMALAGDLVVSSAPDDASLVARDARDGARRWSYPVPRGQSCNPASHAGAVYALCWDKEGGDRTSAARLDLATGEATVLARLRGVDTPVGVDDGELVFLRYRGGAGAAYRSLLRIDVVSGARREVRLPRLALGDATLAAGRLFFIQSSGRVTALDARTGQMLWSNPSDVERLGAPTVSVRENTVYLCNGSGRMLALDLRTGEERWQSGPRSADSGYGMGDETSRVVRVGGALVAAASDGTLFSADPDAPDARP